MPRGPFEAELVDDDATIASLFPVGLPRVILSHTRPEPMLGILRRIDGGPTRTRALGYINRGGTLDVNGMLFANRCTWAHAVDEAAMLAGWARSDVLDEARQAALDGRGDPACLQ